MTKPTQQPMFTTSDLPLFSGTAPRAHDSIFTPREPEPEQLPLPDSVTACNHPPARLFSGYYTDPVTNDDVLWIGCLECGAILKG
jgi:hypothetical protein